MHHDEKEDILDDFALEVKKIEEEAERILKEAQEKKDELVAAAKTDAAKLLISKQAGLDAKKEDMLRKQKDKIDADKAVILEKGRKEAEALEKGSSKNIKKASDLLLSKLDAKVGSL
ncbi:MAG: hypothetical protein HGA85_04000 [Nanoarchaeota archaeon]|nr:hypothetical protein [Nanoarchaeota archaeon]